MPNDERDLTPAEQAIEQVITRVMPHLAGLVADALARVMVKAVRGPLLEEAADLIERSDRLRSLTDDHMGDIEMAADELRDAARRAGEENDDADHE
jgi:hypothetical protein